MPPAVGELKVMILNPKFQVSSLCYANQGEIMHEVKIIDAKHGLFKIHWNGWNSRFDEWIKPGKLRPKNAQTNKEFKRQIAKNTDLVKMPRLAKRPRRHEQANLPNKRTKVEDEGEKVKKSGPKSSFRKGEDEADVNNFFRELGKLQHKCDR